MTKRLIVGISGASGAVLGLRILETLQSVGIESHLVISPSAAVTIAHELQCSVSHVRSLATTAHNVKDVSASIASGSFKTIGMIIAPCSIRTLSEIATGTTSSLLTRAADVTLKERRRLVLMVRETPLHLGHLRSMCAVTEMGAIVMPPVPAFYAHPKSLEDMVNHSIGRALELFDIDTSLVQQWRGCKPSEPARP